MLGLVIFNNTFDEPFVCKTIDDFNDAIRFNSHSYGLIYEYDELIEKMKVISKCYFDHIYKVILNTEIIQYDFEFPSICIDCKKHNNMYGGYKPCSNCPEDKCTCCKRFYPDCICEHDHLF